MTESSATPPHTGPAAAVPPPLQWQAETLWQQLEPHLPGLSIEVVARAESTNSVLIERARQWAGRHDAPVTTPGELQALHARGGAGHEPSGPFGRRAHDTQATLLVAEHQTLGRGRLGRLWQSGPGTSLTFSLGLPMAPRDWSGLSLAVGVTLADALEPPQPGRVPRLRLKWPNDLWLADASGRGRKLGGVLIETVAIGRQRMVVVGVGLNIAPMAAPMVRDFASGFACLQELDPGATPPSALHRVALPLIRTLRQFEREGFAGFAAAYARRDLLRGIVVTAQGTGGEGAIEGLVEGVSNNGALLLRVGATLHELSSGEVSVRVAGDVA